MDSRTTNFRLILALTSFPQDISLNGTSLKVTVGNSTKTIPLTTKEASPLDFSAVAPGSKVEFGLEDAEGFMFGYSELRVPNVAFEKNETEVNEHLRFYLIDKEKDSFVANVYCIFLNKGLFKDKKQEKSPIPKGRNSPLKQNIERQNSRSPTGSTGRHSPSRMGSQRQQQDAKKQEEKNFQAYLNRLVDNHSSQLKSLVDEHNSVNDYIHMNKMHNNLPGNFASGTLENYTPTRLDGSTQLNKSHYNSASVNNLVDAHNRSLSGSDQFRVARFGNDSRADSQVLKDLSPIGERDKGRPYTMTDSLISPVKRQNSTSPLNSPLKKAMTIERNNSIESQFMGTSSPLKKKQSVVADASFDYGRRDIPDAQYYKAQLNNLNNVIINQNAKLADMEITKREADNLRGDVQRSEQARKALQESIQETTNELKTANREVERQLAASITEREGLMRKNNEIQGAVQELTNGLAAAKASLQERDDIIAQQNVKLAELDELRRREKKLQEAIVVADRQRAQDQAAYKANLAQIDQSLQETRKVVENLTQEKKRILYELHKSQEELGSERANHVAAQNEMVLLQKRLENAEGLKHVVASLEAQRDQLNSQLMESRAAAVQTEALFREIEDKMAARMRECENKEREFARDASVMREKVANADSRCEKMSKEISESKLKIVQLNTTISSLEQLICVKEDISRQLETAEKQLDQVMEDRKVLRAQLETLANNQEQTNNRMLEVERQANQLRAAIEEKDEQIEHLTWTVAAMREGQDMYVPTKGDFIDNAVADYINTSNEISRLKLLFIREGEGVYQFGTKRVYIKVEGGKILIRVGGGFLNVDEFVDQYAPLEFEKFARNDPLKKLTKNIAVNKSLIGKCVNQMEKSKNQAYEYRNEANVRVMNNSPLGRKNSRAEY